MRIPDMVKKLNTKARPRRRAKTKSPKQARAADTSQSAVKRSVTNRAKPKAEQRAISSDGRNAWIAEFAYTGSIHRARAAVGHEWKGCADTLADQMFADPTIMAQLQRTRVEAEKKSDVFFSSVLSRVAAFAFTSPLDFYEIEKKVDPDNSEARPTYKAHLNLDGIDKRSMRAIRKINTDKDGNITSLQFHDPHQSLEMMMRMLGAFDDKGAGKKDAHDPFKAMVMRAQAERPKAIIVENEMVWDMGSADADLIQSERD